MVKLQDLLKQATPRPWEVNHEDPDNFTPGIDGPNGESVVWVSCGGGDGIDEIEDARLIAHAVNNLEPLIAAAKEAHTELLESSSNDQLEESDFWKRFEAAIKAAEEVK